MFLLDGIYRRYVNRHQFQPNEIMAIKSVAGSGKTTTLLELAKIHNTKKILYLAFNKALITDIGIKIKKQGIKNLYPQTFHSLAYNAYISNKNIEPDITELRPQSIHNIVPWFKGKSFKIRKYYVDLYIKFCRQPKYSTPKEFISMTIGEEKPLLNTLWNETLLNKFITFDSLIKLSLVNKWLKTYIDKTYDMIMIDETQDFDTMMLNMLLNDTTLPKIFVGDPKQSIYQWRGCINGFNYLPRTSLIIEFYSTFRVGDPACEIIRKKFDDCWMISKSFNETIITNDLSVIKDTKYTYLFRTWKSLLQKAQSMQNIWISNYEEQVEKMRKLHSILKSFDGNIDEENFPDDLPQFLKSLNKDELEKLILDIENNITSKNNAQIKFYTIHSYKGLEDDNIRIADDIDKDNDKNLYYVALTRGMKNIIEDLDKDN
jgi:ATP-dependent exoDNAse (exonuclease V) beta subunit